MTVAMALASTTSYSQTLDVPAPSPKAKVEQRVGVTDFAVDYSSPGVKGRKIYGALVPFDQIWRTGANASTKLTASRDFTFGGAAVPAGTYSLVTIPGASSWTVILSKNTGITGADGYDTKDDAARATVTPATIDRRERLAFLFSDTTNDATRLDLEWDGLRVSVPITVDTKAHVRAAMDKALGDAWRPHYTAGRYAFDNNGDLDEALRNLDTSIGIKATWWNTWYRAQVLGKKGRATDAIAAAERSTELGKGDETFEEFFKENVQKAIADWKKAKS
jgi:hypothetical protein